MNLTKTALILSLTFVTGTAFAQESAKDPVVKARMELMKGIGQNTKVLGTMAGGKADFNADAAAAAKAALLDAAGRIPEAFKTEADDPVSEARPDIWMNMEGFETKANNLKMAVDAMDTSSLEGVQAGMGDVGGACKACHTDFRAKK